MSEELKLLFELLEVLGLSAFVKFGRLFFATSFIVFTFCYFFYDFHLAVRPVWIRFIKYRANLIFNYCVAILKYTRDKTIYLYRRYYLYSFFYFFFKKLFSYPISIIITMFGGVENLKWIANHLLEIIISLILMVAFNEIPNMLLAKIPEWTVALCYFIGRHNPFIDYFPAFADLSPWLKQRMVRFNNPQEHGKLNPFFNASVVFIHTFLCLLVIFFYFFWFTVPIVCTVLAFSVFWWVLLIIIFALRYLQFILKYRAFKAFCKTQRLFFSKASLLFVPVTTIAFKKQPLRSDQELLLEQEYKNKDKKPPSFDGGGIGGLYFVEEVEEHHKLVGVPPTANRVFVNDGFLGNSDLFKQFSKDNRNAYQEWVRLNTHKNKIIPFSFIGSDSQIGVVEKSFVKLFWINDIVVNKTFVNRLNYSIIETLDEFMMTDRPLTQSIVYCEASLLSSSEKSFAVTNNLRISLCKSSVASWVDLDYDQYLKQFVLNRVFNKLKLQSLNGVGQSDQHLLSGIGVRSAVYKVYTPDFLVNQNYNLLNNPFRSEELYDLHSNIHFSKKGRVLPLGKLTDIVLLLKSLRTLYRTLGCFSEVPDYEIEKGFKFSSLFNLRNKKLDSLKLLENNLVSKRFGEFCLTSPFSFLPYSHIHHIAYETRPDRFYLLPTSVDFIIRAFLNRLLTKFVKQIKISNFYLLGRNTQTSLDSFLRTNLPDTILSKLEYVLYKFFSNLKSLSNNSDNRFDVKDVQSLGGLSYEASLHQFGLLNSFQKVNRINDLLFVCDELFSSVNFSIFGSKLLSLVYDPCYSSFLKLFINFKKLGNLESLQTCWFSLLYSVFNSEKIKSLGLLNGSSLNVYLLLIWRAVIKSVQASLSYFLPKVYLNQTYSYLLSTDAVIKKVGGLDIYDRYEFGMTSLKNNNFLHPFTAIYNRNLLSINFFSSLANPKENEVNIGSNVNKLDYNSRVFFDKTKTGCIWWWLLHRPRTRERDTISKRYPGSAISGFGTSNFLSLLFESYSGTASLDFLNFASLSYDPTGALGSTTIVPSERFFLSEGITSLYSQFDDYYPVIDFMRQDVLRRELEGYFGHDGWFNAARVESFINKEQQWREEKAAGPIMPDDYKKDPPKEIIDTINPVFYLQTDYLFGRPEEIPYDKQVFKPGSTLPSLSSYDGYSDDSRYPIRFWDFSYYNMMLVDFFRAFAFIKHKRARLRYKSAATSPLTPLLYFFKRNRSVLFFKKARKVKKKVKRLKKLYFAGVDKCNRRGRAVAKLRQTSQRVFVNNKLKKIMLHTFFSLFKKSKHNIALSDPHPNDPIGGPEVQQRSLFRVLQTFVLNNNSRSRKKLHQRPAVFNKKRKSLGLDRSFIKFNAGDVGFKDLKIYAAMRPSLAKVLRNKNQFRPLSMSNLELFTKKNDFSELTHVGAGVSPFINKLAKVLCKSNKVHLSKKGRVRLAFTKFKIKKSSSVLNLVKANALAIRYAKRIKRRNNRIAHFLTAGKGLSLHEDAARMMTRTRAHSAKPYGVARSLKKPFWFKDLADESPEIENGEGESANSPRRARKAVAELLGIKYKHASLARSQRTQQVYPDSMELNSLSNKLFGLSQLEKTKNVLETHFLVKNLRKTKFLKDFLSTKLLKKINLKHYKRLLRDDNNSVFGGQPQQLITYSLFLILLRLIKHKQDLHTFGKYKDIFLFKKLKLGRGFSYSEHSFEEGFFTLLGQRTPLVQNQVLVKPISKSLVFNQNLLRHDNSKNYYEGVLFAKNKGINFASNTVASLFFFNYVFLGKGTFFGNPITNPIGLTTTVDAMLAALSFLDVTRYFNDIEQFTTKSLDFVNSKIFFSKEEKKFQKTYKAEKIVDRIVPSLRFLTAHKKIPFFIQWPFKISKQLTELHTKKKRKLVESKEIKLLRELFLFNKVRFLNSALTVLAPWYKKVRKRSVAGNIWNAMMNEDVFEDSVSSIHRSSVGDSTRLRKEAGRAALGVLLHKDSKEQFTGSEEMLWAVEDLYPVYSKHFNFEPFVNWGLDTKKTLVYNYWRKFFEISHFNLGLQKVRYLQQLKKNLLDASIHHKFSPLSYDLRSQLPVRPFVRIRQAAKLGQVLRYKQKKIKPGSVRRHIRYLFIAYGFLTFFNRQRIPLDSVTFYKDNVSQEIFDAYRRFPLDEVNNTVRKNFYKRKSFLEYRMDSFVRKRDLATVAKNFSPQSSFKRAVAAAIRFNALADESSYGVLPLYSQMKLPWLSFSVNKLRVQLDVNRTRGLVRKFNIVISPTNTLVDEGVRKSKDVFSFVSGYFYDDDNSFEDPESLVITEFTNQSSNFERPGFKLSFVSELITRKFLINQENVPLWFLNWLQSEGYVLLHRYVAYKKHLHSTLSQVSHAPVPNSSGIEKLVAAFDLNLEDNILYETLKRGFYKPLLSVLHSQHTSFSGSVLRKNATQSTADYSKFADSIPTVYDLLLSKAVRSFFMTQGVVRELQKASWHKTEYCRANRFGWLLPMWTLRTFKRLNVLNFISLKKDIKFKNDLGLNSLNKQLTINSADGYFYYLLLKEKSNSEIELNSLFTKESEPVFSTLNRPFNMLGQKALSFDLKGFKSIFSKDEHVKFRHFLRWGRGYKYHWRRMNQKNKPLRAVQTKNFRQLRSSRMFRRNRYFHKEKRGIMGRIRLRWGNPRYCYLKSKRLWQNMIVNFLFYIHIICYQRVLRRLASNWEVADSPLRYYSNKKRKISQESVPNYFDYKIVANPDQNDYFSAAFKDNLDYNAGYISYQIAERPHNKRIKPPLALDYFEDEKTPEQKQREIRYACQKFFEDILLVRYWFKPEAIGTEFLAGEDARSDRFQFFSIQAPMAKRLFRKRPATFLYRPRARYAPQFNHYPVPQLPRTTRFAYFFQYKAFLRSQGRTYLTSLDRNFSRLRGSRIIRKSQPLYIKTVPLRNTVKTKGNPYAFYWFANKKKSPPPSLLERIYFPSKNDDSEVLETHYSRQKAYKDADTGYFSEPFQKKRGARVFGAINNRALISKMNMLKSGLTYQLDEPFSLSKRDPWEPKRPLLFLKYVNSFYFIRNSKYSRSITSLPTLFSTKHLTVSFERFNHDGSPSQLSKHVFYSRIYKRLLDESLVDYEELDPELSKNFKYTISSTQDEQAYAERSFSYALTQLYGLHRPVFDLNTLNSFLTPQRSTVDLCNIRTTPWWMQRQEFRKKHMNFTKLDSLSSYRRGGLWGTFLKKIPYWKSDDTDALDTDPFAWFNRWYKDRDPHVRSSSDWFLKTSEQLPQFNRYRRFFRHHQVVNVSSTFARNSHDNKSSYWYDNSLIRDFKLPYRFIYYKENPIIRTNVEELEPLLNKGSSSSTKNKTSKLLEFTLDILNYCVSRGKPPVTKSVNKFENMMSDFVVDRLLDSDGPEEQVSEGSTLSGIGLQITPEIEENSIVFQENEVFFSSVDGSVELGVSTKTQLVEDVFLLNILKEQKKKQKNLNLINVCNFCVDDFTYFLNVFEEIQIYNEYLYDLESSITRRHWETFNSISRYMNIEGLRGFPYLLHPGFSIDYDAFWVEWSFEAGQGQITIPYRFHPANFAEDAKTTSYARRTTRKAFSLLFYIDESRNNNFTNKRAFTSFQVSKLATIFNYGSGFNLINERQNFPVDLSGLEEGGRSSVYVPKGVPGYANGFYTPKVVQSGLFGANSPDFLPVDTKNQKQFLSFAWFFISRSWSTINSYGFYNCVSFSMNWLISDGLYRMPLYFFNSCVTMLLAPFENLFTRFMNVFVIICFISVFVIVSSLLFLL